MKRDFHVLLPTFAADYSGACAALFDLNGSVVIHDPSGCIGNYTAYDEPRAYEGNSRIYTSALDDMQALFGLDDALAEASCHAHDEVRGDFVALIGTPNPMVLGTDYRAVASQIGERCGVPGIALETTGARYYDHGLARCLLTLARELVAPRAGEVAPWTPGRGRRVNLLGATPLDVTSQTSIDTVRDLLAEDGWTVASVWSMGSSLDEYVQGLDAACNLVLTTSGLPLARWMQATYGIPYVVGSLAGRTPVLRTLERMERAAAGEPVDAWEPPASAANPNGPRALVVGDQVLANGWRDALMTDAGFAQVDVATFFTAETELLAPGDLGTVGEEELLGALASGGYDILVGDTLLDAFIPHGSACRHVEVPHVAVSSRISWDKPAPLFGEEFLARIERVREAVA